VNVATRLNLGDAHPFVGMDAFTMLASRAAERTNHPCLHWSSVGHERTWTYGEFLRDVETTAAGLASRGVGVGSPLIIHLDNSPAFLLTWFACARLGAVAVDVNARYTRDELLHAMSVTGADGIVTNDPSVVGIAASPWVIVVDRAVGTSAELLRASLRVPEHRADPEAALCVQFTSGSTSRPKAVLYAHANALWAGRESAAHWDLKADDIQLVFPPLFHTLALFWQTMAIIWVGGTIVLQEKFSASRFWEVSTQYNCTRASYLPLLKELATTNPPPPNCYRSWVSGWQDPEISELFGIGFFSGWGMTETVTQPICSLPGDVVPAGAIGRVSPGYEIRIEREDGTLADLNEVGDLKVRGVRGLSLFCEYYGSPEVTAESFDEDGFFKSGDRVMALEGGFIQFVDRAKDMLKVGGENVAASEVERVIGAIDGVSDVAVVARADRVLSQVPVAFVVSTRTEDPEATCAIIDAACTEKLARFKVPRSIYLVDELPRAVNKVNRARLREYVKAIDADQIAPGRLDHYPEITTEVETQPPLNARTE
jgi:crotonobetaine/carnitine-CoA ligase